MSSRKSIGHLSFDIGNSLQSRAGYIAITSILVISIVALTISTSISLLGIGEAKSSLDFRKAVEAEKFAQGCVEEALIRLRNDEEYSSGTLTQGDSSCTINISGVGDDRVIDAIATTVGPTATYTKRIQASVRRLGTSINLIDWIEVE